MRDKGALKITSQILRFWSVLCYVSSLQHVILFTMHTFNVNPIAYEQPQHVLCLLCESYGSSPSEKYPQNL